MEDNQEENEDISDEDIKIEQISQSIADHVKFSMSDSDGKNKRKKNDLSSSNRLSRADGVGVNVCNNVNNENNVNDANYM